MTTPFEREVAAAIAEIEEEKRSALEAIAHEEAELTARLDASDAAFMRAVGGHRNYDPFKSKTGGGPGPGGAASWPEGDEAYYRHQAVAKATVNRRTELSAERATIEARYRRKMGGVTDVPMGPQITAPDVRIPPADADQQLRVLRNAKAAIEPQREQLQSDLATLTGVISDAENRASALADETRLGIVDGDTAAAIQRRLENARRAFARVQEQIAALDQEGLSLDERIEQRLEVVTAEREARIDREIRAAAAAAADVLLPAMVGMTRLARVLQYDESGSGLSPIAALDLDDPRSRGRAFLEELMKTTGWSPWRSR